MGMSLRLSVTDSLWPQRPSPTFLSYWGWSSNEFDLVVSTADFPVLVVLVIPLLYYLRHLVELRSYILRGLIYYSSPLRKTLQSQFSLMQLYERHLMQSERLKSWGHPLGLSFVQGSSHWCPLQNIIREAEKKWHILALDSVMSSMYLSLLQTILN